MKRAFYVFAIAITLAAASAIAQEGQITVRDFIQPDASGGVTVQDPSAPVSFRLPSGWELTGGQRWGNHETTLRFEDSRTKTTAALYYQYPLQDAVPSSPAVYLRDGMNLKVQQRQQEAIYNYHVREGSVQMRSIGSLPALSFFGEGTVTGQAMNEYMIRTVGTATKAHFFVMTINAPLSDEFVKRFDDVAATLRIQ